MDKIADIVAGITFVALVTTIVSRRESSRVIGAIGTAYSNALKAAMGR